MANPWKTEGSKRPPVADDKTAAEHAALEAAIFDDGSRALAGALAPDANLGISRNEGSLMLAFSHLAQRAIEDVYADCGDTDAGVLSSNVGQYIAREVHEVLFGEPDGVLRDDAAVRRVAPDRETLARVSWTYPDGTVHMLSSEAIDALLASGVLGVPADATSRTEYALDYRAGIMCTSDERADAEEMQQFIPDSFIVRRTVTETEWEPDGPDEGSDRA